MEIKEYFDGYCLSHDSEDYKYQGKSPDVIDIIGEKVKELLKQDLKTLKSKTLKDHNIEP